MPTERVVVALTGASGNDEIIRRAAVVARRTGATLIGVHVRVGSAVPSVDPRLDAHRALLAELGGTYHETVGSDVADALVQFARAEQATQILLGATRQTRWSELVRGSVVNRVVRLAGPIDVYVVSQRPDSADAVPVRVRVAPRRRTPRRYAAAWAAAFVSMPLLTVVLVALRGDVSLASSLLLYLLVVVAIAAIGGRTVALVSAIAAFLLANWFLTPPLHTWTIGHGENLFALIVFLTVAAVVSNYVSIAARRAVESERARAEAESLARLSATFAEPDPLLAVVTHLRSTFELESVAVLRRDGDRGWTVEVAAGADPPRDPKSAGVVEELGPDVVLAMTGRPLSADDRRVLGAFAAQLAAAVERAELTRAASRAEALDRANALRTALLQAVSHDLRTPLAAIKASVSSLRAPDVVWGPEQSAEFLAAIEDETDRLTTLVTNLLDLSRIQAGELHPGLRAVSLEEVVPAALLSLGASAGCVALYLPDTLPDVVADPALLERVVANLTANAIRFSPAGSTVVLRAHRVDCSVVLEVIDRGPGIPTASRTAAMRPFQRLDDSRHGSGVGLGLAIASGFSSAMHAELCLDDTPGGGLTARIALRTAECANDDLR